MPGRGLDMTKTINRRRFMAGSIAVGAIGATAPVWRTAVRAAETPRKVVTVDGKRVKVIDIHGHIVIPKAEEVLAGSKIKGRFPANQDMAKSAQERFDRMDRRG